MRIAVFGATGGTGREVACQALERGDEVTVLVRDAARLELAARRLRVVSGDVLDAATVEGVLAGQDAVVSALGTRPWRHVDICSSGTARIVECMSRVGPKRLIVVSSLGASESLAWAPWATRKLVFGWILGRALADKTRMETTVRVSGLEWVLVRPVMLTDGPPTGRVRVATDGSIGRGKITRGDVAAYCLAQLGADGLVGQAPVIAS